MALGVGEPVRGVVGAEQVGVGESPRAPVGLDAACPGAYIGAKFGSAATTS